MAQDLAEQYRLAGKEWVDVDSAASLSEELKTPILNQRMLALDESLAMNKREMIVKASDEWHKYISEMVEARTKANLLKVKMEWIKMRYAQQQSEEATRRSEMRL
jgi:hypothetical protein